MRPVSISPNNSQHEPHKERRSYDTEAYNKEHGYNELKTLRLSITIYDPTVCPSGLH
jgi:hypothetical protein